MYLGDWLLPYFFGATYELALNSHLTVLTTPGPTAIKLRVPPFEKWGLGALPLS